MAGPKGVYDYVSDDGGTYRLKLDASNAAAAGMTAATVATHLPGGYHPRYILATHPTNGSQRKIVIGSPSHALFVGGTNTINLEEYSGTHSTTAAYQVLSRVGEKRYNQ